MVHMRLESNKVGILRVGGWPMLDTMYCRQCKVVIDSTHEFCPKCGASQKTGTKPLAPQVVIMQPERSSIHIVVTVLAIIATCGFGTAGYLYVRDSDAMNPDKAHKKTAKSSASPPAATMPNSNAG